MKRINAKLIISWDKFQSQGKVDLITKEITETLAKKYGGLTLTNVLGAWCDDADLTKDKYNDLQYEDGLQFDISCSPESFDIAFIQSAFTPAKRINAKWIHFEVFESSAHHFDITKIN